MGNTADFVEASKDKTLILIDIKFLLKEFLSASKFYSDLYSGEKQDLEKKELADEVHLNLLHQYICEYGHASVDNSMMYLLYNSPEVNFFDREEYERAQFVRYQDDIIEAMDSLLFGQKLSKRCIMVADDYGYEGFIRHLQEFDWSIGLIKHRIESNNDFSAMPTDIPYQYCDYVMGRCLGLGSGEL